MSTSPTCWPPNGAPHDHLHHDGRPSIADALGDCDCETGPDLGRALAEVRRRPVSPGLFAIYHDLAIAAGEDDPARTAGLMDEFSALALNDGAQSGVVTMRDEDLEGQAARHRRMLDDDESFGVSLGPVDAARWRRCAPASPIRSR